MLLHPDLVARLLFEHRGGLAPLVGGGTLEVPERALLRLREQARGRKELVEEPLQGGAPLDERGRHELLVGAVLLGERLVLLGRRGGSGELRPHVAEDLIIARLGCHLETPRII